MDPTSGLDNDSVASASSGAASSRPSRTREARPADNQSTVVPAAVSRDRQATAQRGDISKFGVEANAQSRTGQPPPDADDTRNVISPPVSSPRASDTSASKEARAAQREGVTSSGPISSTSSIRPTTQPRLVTAPPPSRDVLPSQALRDTGSKISLGLPETGERREKNESSLHQVDSSRERNATRPRAQQVDLTASVQPSAKPSTPSPPALKQPSASTSPLPPPPAPVLAKMASSRPRGALPHGTQVPSRGTPFESPHPSGEAKGKAPPDEQSRMNSSVTPRGLPLPPDNRAATASGPPSQPQPVSAPHRLDKSNSRVMGSEGVSREAKRTTEGPTSDRKERKGAAAPEDETRPEDSAISSDGAKRRKAGPNPPTSYSHKQASTESVERTYSSNPSRGNDSSAPRPPEVGNSRGKVGQSSDSAPPLSIKESHSTRPPLASNQSQPKLDIGVPPKGNSIGVTPLPPASTQGQHRSHDIERTRAATPQPLSRTPSVASGPQIPNRSSDMSPTTETTSSGLKGGPKSQIQPEVPSKLDFSQREERALAALDGRYQPDPFIGRFESSPPNLLPIHERGIMKQTSAANLNQNKFQHGGLTRPPGMITSVSHSSGDIMNLINLKPTKFQQEPSISPESDPLHLNTGIARKQHDESIITPPPPEPKNPPTIGIQQGAGSTLPNPSGDGRRGEGLWGSSRDGRPSGRGGTPGGGGPPAGGPPEGGGGTGGPPGRDGPPEAGTGDGGAGRPLRESKPQEQQRPQEVDNAQSGGCCSSCCCQ